MRRFPDVQRELVTALAGLPEVGDGHAGARAPANLADVLPFVRVRRRGGPSDRLNDHATIDLDVWAGTYTAAEDLAEQIRQWLVGPPPPISRFDSVDCPTGPFEAPWGDETTVRRFAAVYTITSRRYTAA